MCAGVGVWVLLESPFCVKHQIFTNISWDFVYFLQRLDMLHTMFEVQSIHLQAALWMGMSLSQIKKIPSFWQWPPPPLGITEVPGVYFFPFFYVWVSFFFTRAGQVFFFPSHVGQVFFSFYVWVIFFLPLSGPSFFFYKNFLLPPPLKSNCASLSLGCCTVAMPYLF